MDNKPIAARPQLVLLSRPILCRDPVNFLMLPVRIVRPGGQNSRVDRWYRQALWKETNSALDRFPKNFTSMQRVFEIVPGERVTFEEHRALHIQKVGNNVT
jgi:hypothetical protein